MKHLSVLVLLTLLLTDAAATERNSSYEEIFSQVSSGDAVLIDARTDTGPGTESIQGAHWIRYPDITNRLPQVIEAIADCLPRKRIYLFCHVGAWAGFFSQKLQEAGIETVNVGGYSSWPTSTIPRAVIQTAALNEACPY